MALDERFVTQLFANLVVNCPLFLVLGFGLAGVLRDDRKQYAAVMLLVSGAFTLWLAWALFAR